MIEHEEVVGHGIVRVLIEASRAGGWAGLGAHLAVEDAVSQRLRRAYLGLVRSDAHGEVARAQHAEIPVRRLPGVEGHRQAWAA